PYDATNDHSGTEEVKWVDPYVGLRLKGQLSENWAVELYGDAGGFGIGAASELSVLMRGLVVWTLKPGFNLLGGYRMFDLKSKRESGDRQTEVDLRIGGPTVGVEFKF